MGPALRACWTWPLPPHALQTFLSLPGSEPLPKAAFEVGPHAVTVGDDSGTHVANVKVSAGNTVTAD